MVRVGETGSALEIIKQRQSDEGVGAPIEEAHPDVEIVSAICTIVSSRESKTTALDLIAGAVANAYQNGRVLILSRDPGSRETHLEVALGFEEEPVEAALAALKKTISFALKTKKAVLFRAGLPGKGDREGRERGAGLGAGAPTGAVWPIVCGRRAAGCIVIIASDVEPVQLAGLAPIKLYAELAAVVLQEAAKRDDGKRSVASAERLRVLGEATRLIGDEPDVASALRKMAATLGRIFKARSGVIFEADHDYLTSAVVWGDHPSREGIEEVGRGLAFKSLADRRPAVVKNGREIKRLAGGKNLGKKAMRSAVAIPIIYKSDVLGVVAVFSNVRGHFSEEDLALLDVFSGHLGIILQNIKMNSRLKETELAREHSANEAIIEVTGDGIFMVDAAMTIQVFNGALERITGFSADRIVARKQCRDVIKCETKEGVLCEKRCPFKSLRAEHDQFKATDVTISCRSRGSNDKRIKVEVIYSVIADKNGLKTGIAVARDMSELRVTKDEMRIAREIQRGLLPQKSPTIAGHDVHFICTPAKQVGGDYLDFIPLSGGRIGIVVSDIAGKSLPAALFVSMQKGLMRSAAVRSSSVEAPLFELNERIVADTSPEVFITMVYGIYEPTRGFFTYANAGHIPPILYREGKCALLELPQPPLGVDEHFQAEKRMVMMSKGDILVLLSDGVVDARNDDGRFFGIPRLCRIIERHPKMTAEALADHIYHRVREFAGRPMQDDFTILILKCERDFERVHTAHHVFKNSRASVTQIRRFVMAEAEAMPFVQDELSHIQIAVGEAVSNAFRHGKALDADEDKIEVVCERGEDFFKVQISDRGTGFTAPGLSRVTIPPASSSRGRGIYLMKMLMDEIAYEMKPGGCTVTMIKKLSRAVEHAIP